MSQGNFDNRDEKELRKREEKSAEEKQWDEKWRRDPVSAIVWAGILIWAGLVFLADNLGLLDRVVAALPGEPGDFAGLGAWSFVFMGAGVILIGEVLVRSLIPEYRAPVTGTLIFAVILIGIGLGDLMSWGLIFALVLIVAGVSLLLRGLLSRP